MSISTDYLVHTIPGVVEGVGASISFNGLCLTDSPRVPIGTLLGLTTLSAVQAYFGSSSIEYELAGNYFKGFNNSTQKPGLLYFWQYPTLAVPAYLRGGSMAKVTLDALKAMTGVLTLTVDGTTASTTAIVLTTATSFSSVATIITAALATAFPVELPVCTYDATAQAFVITSSVDGTQSTMSFGSGAIAPMLKLTVEAGALTSQGANAVTEPADEMTKIDSLSRNWVSFFTTWESDTDEALKFADWTNSSTNYTYLPWVTTGETLEITDTTSLAVLLNGITQIDANGNSTVLVPPTYSYDNTAVCWNTANLAAALSGFIASVNLNQTGGWVDYAYLAQSGLGVTCSNRLDAGVLESKRVMYLGDFASRTQDFQITFAGAISGIFDWLNDFLGNVYLRAQLENAWMALRTQRKSLPYVQASYDVIKQVFAGNVLEPAKVLGCVNAGVILDEVQTTSINTLAGVDDAAASVTRDGYYIHIVPPTVATRNARKLDINIWYTSGGTINRLNISVFNVQ